MNHPMTKIYIPGTPVGDTFRLDRQFKKRLTKVMRLSIGDEVEVLTPTARLNCKIANIFPDAIELAVVDSTTIEAQSKIRIILGQAIPKGDRFEWLIQKATEIGIAEIYPLITERTIVRPSNTSSKLQRWSEIAQHAAGQSENSAPTMIHEPRSIAEFIRNVPENGIRFVLNEAEGSQLRNVLQTNSTFVFAVGPEGGWTETEIAQFQGAGFTSVHLGARILRAETPGIVVASILQYVAGDFA